MCRGTSWFQRSLCAVGLVSACSGVAGLVWTARKVIRDELKLDVLTGVFSLGLSALGLIVGVAALAVSWLGYRADRHEHAAQVPNGDIADSLALAVRGQWEAEAQLRRLKNDPYPLPVSWRPAESDLMEPWPLLVEMADHHGRQDDWATCPEDLAGTDTDVTDVFTVRAPGRRLLEFEQQVTLDEFDFTASSKLPAAQIRDLGARRWLHAGESVILFGPVGVGKTHVAQALGHLAVRQGAHVRFAKTSRILADLAGGHADRSWEKRIRELIRPDVLILDDFAMRQMSAAQADDLYELVSERQGRSLIITSNRASSDWYPLFMNGPSYRPNKRPRNSTDKGH
ncbi:ATP-binding protein [Streptomyces sp. NPDC086554]|uniref:ATP-binding protein n=1 Tax=Streptomyces sp. NPDC086554 TaxID=3154864 RepID=UPI0034462F2B